MRRSLVWFCLAVSACAVAVPEAANAQITPDLPSISLKSGETLEIADLWYAVHCQSRLKSAPTVEVLEGPPEITVSVKKAMVVPREQNCSKPIEGAKLYVTACEIADYGTSELTIRITFDTKDGERRVSETYNVTLFPKE
jgi:hypothetical protein